MTTKYFKEVIDGTAYKVPYVRDDQNKVALTNDDRTKEILTTQGGLTSDIADSVIALLKQDNLLR